MVVPLFRIWGFPSKTAHCVAFECSNQSETKQDTKLPLF